jgi:DNA-binding protein HU-beta
MSAVIAQAIPLLVRNTNEGVSRNMNKNELIGAVADTSGLSRSDATKAVEGVFDTITSTLSRGDEVRLVGFGTFSVAKRKASTGRNPRTGEPMTIKASTHPKFTAGKGLMDTLNCAPRPAQGRADRMAAPSLERPFACQGASFTRAIGAAVVR